MGTLPVAASYELMSIPNVAGFVNRVDPVSGTSLGSYTGAGTNARWIEHVPSRGEALVASTNRVFRFDYSTGIGKGFITENGIEDIAYDSRRDQLLVLSGAEVRRYRASDLTSLGSFSIKLPNNTVSRSITVTPDGNLTTAYAFPGVLGMSIGFGLTNLTTLTETASVVVVNTTSTLAGTLVGKVGYAQVAGGWNTYVVVRNSVGSTVGARLSQNTGGALIGTGGWGVPPGFGGQTGRAVAVASGHFGFYLIGQNGTITSVRHMEPTIGPNQLDERTFAFTPPNGSFSTGMVVAPEPGTFLALGAGLAWLARRRRRA